MARAVREYPTEWACYDSDDDEAEKPRGDEFDKPKDTETREILPWLEMPLRRSTDQ